MSMNEHRLPFAGYRERHFQWAFTTRKTPNFEGN
jgi:hypothetical protein